CRNKAGCVRRGDRHPRFSLFKTLRPYHRIVIPSSAWLLRRHQRACSRAPWHRTYHWMAMPSYTPDLPLDGHAVVAGHEAIGGQQRFELFIGRRAVMAKVMGDTVGTIYEQATARQLGLMLRHLEQVHVRRAILAEAGGRIDDRGAKAHTFSGQAVEGGPGFVQKWPGIGGVEQSRRADTSLHLGAIDLQHGEEHRLKLRLGMA